MPGDRFLNMAATLSPTPFVPATLDHPDGVVTSRCLLVAYSSFPARRPFRCVYAPSDDTGRSLCCRQTREPRAARS